VSDAAVIAVADRAAGEVPKAFIVKHPAYAILSDSQLAAELNTYVQQHKAKYKWLVGGIEFVDMIPKSPSGKILRRMLRDRERLRRKQGWGKL
jgi:acyl-coenzyme A synthetase/AMP-(fatty) acid ligase